MKGKLITFEGIDASGKTTLARAVYRNLKAEGFSVVLVTEPTSTWLGKAVRKAIERELNPYSESFLFLADHANLVESIKKWLAENKLIICDRYNDSNYAYQGVRLRERLARQGIDSIKWLKSIQEPFTVIPELTFLLNIKPELSLKRISYRRKSKFEDLDFLQEVQKVYLSFANSEKRYKVLDATKSISELVNKCLLEIKRLL
jgi:dTMP kinase